MGSTSDQEELTELQDLTDLLEVPDLTHLDGSSVKFEFAEEMTDMLSGVKTDLDWMENLIRL